MNACPIMCVYLKNTHKHEQTQTQTKKHKHKHNTHSNTHHVCATFIFHFSKGLPAGACRQWSLSYGRPSSSCAQCPFLPSAPASVYRRVSSSITLSLPTSSPAQFNFGKKRIWAAVPKLAAWPAFPGRPASSPEKTYVTQENTKMQIACSLLPLPFHSLHSHSLPSFDCHRSGQPPRTSPNLECKRHTVNHS